MENIKKLIESDSTLEYITNDILTGGKADDKTLEDIAKKHNVLVDDLKKEHSIGLLVEQEHTNDPARADEISRDHLCENPKYYSEGIEKGIFDEKDAIDLYNKLFK